MSDEYHGRARTDVLDHLTAVPARLLEIGCGSGATVAELRRRGELAQAVGVELDGPSAQLARAQFDVVLEGAVESAPIEDHVAQGSLDMVLCLDVLEHLVDPWAQVRRLAPLLRPGGVLVVSLPNIRNGKFIRNLLIKGDFVYRDAGLLDRTHLRFFTLATARDLLTQAGLVIELARDTRTYRPSEPKYWLGKVPALAELGAKQFVLIARRPA
jgi:2-polyprenyl-3-methyl-5-hydroxy-6-metoxy-1,4-benzoquinol methylase